MKKSVQLSEIKSQVDKDIENILNGLFSLDIKSDTISREALQSEIRKVRAQVWNVYIRAHMLEGINIESEEKD